MEVQEAVLFEFIGLVASVEAIGLS